MPKVKRYFLEIKKEHLKLEKAVLPSDIRIILDKNKDININKFFYRQIGKDHFGETDYYGLIKSGKDI